MGQLPSNQTLMSGWTQQLVCPYMVSGRSVAATKKTSLPERGLQGELAHAKQAHWLHHGNKNMAT